MNLSPAMNAWLALFDQAAERVAFRVAMMEDDEAYAARRAQEKMNDARYLLSTGLTANDVYVGTYGASA